jgi:hypothetical protein
VRQAVEASPYGFAFVLTPMASCLGRLRAAALQADRDATAGALMEPGPSTVRADTAPQRLRERLERGKLSIAVSTDPDGRLLGIVRRDDLPRCRATQAL